MTHFSREAFRSLGDLAANNRREWFEENRGRYERFIKEPAQRFIVGVGERLDEVSPHLRADPRPVGGSLFRIYRDVRFSKDKSPYKTAAGIQFRHSRGRALWAWACGILPAPRSGRSERESWPIRRAGSGRCRTRASRDGSPSGETS